MSCPFRHHLAYNLRYSPKTDSTPLLLGSFFHEAIAEIIRGRDPHHIIEACVSEEIDGIESDLMTGVIEDIGEQALELAIRADSWMGISDGLWETICLPDGEPLVEKKLTITIPGWAGYTGIADWVARNLETGNVWLFDWKTRGRLVDPRNEELNLQLMSYVYQLRQSGVDVDKAGIIQVLSKLPAEPKRNKDGSMSRAKIMTDWETYEKALIRAGLDVSDYQDMKDKLDAEYFQLAELYFSDSEVDNAWENIICHAANKISEDTIHMRHMSPWNCRNCPYKAPCLADLRGYDALGILESEDFVRRD